MDAPSNPAVTRWLTAAQQGDQQAIEQLWQLYFERLSSLAKVRLGERERRVADEEDVALSVFRNFCDAATTGRLESVRNRDELWRLLVAMTRQKLIDHHRHLNRAKRGAGNVRGESIFAGDDNNNLAQFLGAEPTPEYIVSVEEEIERLLGSLSDEQRRIATLKFEGYSSSEISEQMCLAPRSLERKLAQIRECWTKLAASAERD